MAQKNFMGRIALKRDVEAIWHGVAQNFVPLDGEMILYKPDSGHNYYRYKIGDGTTTIVNLPFQFDYEKIENEFKPIQGVVISPEASNSYADAFIDTIAQDRYGKITATKKKVGNATITISPGTKLTTGGNFTTNQSTNETITLNHETTTRSNTTNSETVNYGNTFNVIDTISSDATGHITAVNTKTVTMPAAVDISGKMDKANPIGTGSFSLNRKADTDIGMNSFAEGSEVTASGAISHAEGYITTATKTCSHAEGYMATSGGDASHAEGWDTKAIASFSHAEGRKTLASGNGSHAEGYGTTASGTYSHAEGKYTMSIGSSSHAEGIGDSIEVSITGDANATNYTLVQALEEDTYIGAGYIVVLNDIYATITEYDETTLTITVDTTLNTDEALNATTVKIYNHIASGSCAHIEGYCNIASNDSAHAEGEFSIASGYASHAEGQGTASGDYSHAEGVATTASGGYSHAENYYTTASGRFSHAEGYYTTASGDSSHAEGVATTASGYASHAEGSATTASGKNSHAEGSYTTASSLSQHVQGEYNILDTESPEAHGTYAHIVGNGTNSKRSNAHTLDWSGNAWFAGDVYVGSTSGTNKDTGSKKLATEEYVGNQITANAPNLTNYKTKQTAVSSPTASGSATAFIDTISQDANGKITVTKKKITASALGLDRAMSFLGTTTTALTDGATTNPITISGASTTAAKGDVVIVSGTDQEFIWTGSTWEEFGNASSHSIKGHTHTVTHNPAGTISKTSITPAGTVSQPTFSGSAVNSGENTGTNFSAAPGGHKHSVTAAGTVSQPTFTGTEATITISHTPAGTVSQPTFTGTAVTSGKPDTTNVTTIYSITGVGSLPSASLSAGTAPSHTYTAPSLTASIANKCMTFSWSAGSHSFSAGTYPTLTFSAGSLPTRSSAISMPNTNHTHSVTAAGTVSQPTFTGSSVSGSTKYTPAGTVSQPTFTGSAVNSGANTGTNTSVAPAKHKHSVTAAGTVSQPTFTGTAAEHSHTFTGTSATITTSGSSN